jgi:hypothetical protein
MADSATAFWSAVAKMHGASLHRSYRFRGVKHARRSKPAVRPEKAASHPSSPVLRSPQSEEGPHELQDAAASAWLLGHTPKGKQRRHPLVTTLFST